MINNSKTIIKKDGFVVNAVHENDMLLLNISIPLKQFEKDKQLEKDCNELLDWLVNLYNDSDYNPAHKDLITEKNSAIVKFVHRDNEKENENGSFKSTSETS